MADQHVGTGQVLERLGNLPGAVLVHAIAIDCADYEAVKLGDGLEQAVAFRVEDQPQLFEVLVGGRDDEGLRNMSKHPARVWMCFQQLGRFQRPPHAGDAAILDWQWWWQRRGSSSFVNAGERHCCTPNNAINDASARPWSFLQASNACAEGNNCSARWRLLSLSPPPSW